MPGINLFAIQKRQSNDLFEELVAAFTGGGGQNWFTQVKRVDDANSSTIVLQSAAPVDSMIATDATQTYRIALRAPKVTSTAGVVTRPSVQAFLGSKDQIAVNGEAITISASAQPHTVWASANEPSPLREYSYRLTLTDRGFALAMWVVTNVNSTAYNSLLVVQRPVNPTTGAPKQDGQAPIFALRRSPDSTTNVFDVLLVRQKDDPSAGAWVTLDKASESNLYRCTMDWSHPNLFDNFSHIIKFPFGFASPSALYLEEMDLVCLVNGTAFASNQDVKITMYGESSERKYTTTWGDVEYGRPQQGNSSPAIPKIIGGARIGLLTANGGVTPPAS